MTDKTQILTMLNEIYNRWERLLAGMSEDQITARNLHDGYSIKDDIAHLMAWQQRSIARMDAALNNREPRFPVWIEGVNPDTDEYTDQNNAWIYNTHKDRPWQDVYRDWRAGFQRFIQQNEAVPENDMVEEGKYPWLWGKALSFVPVASFEHHEEHYDELMKWLREHSLDV